MQDGTKYAAGKRCFYYSSPQALQPLQEPLQELHPPCNERRPAKAVKVLRGLIMRPGETVTPISSDCREARISICCDKGKSPSPGQIRQAVFNSSREYVISMISVNLFKSVSRAAAAVQSASIPVAKSPEVKNLSM